MSTLQLRLKNCIQTILELEPQIGADLSDRYFVEEFMALRRFLDSVEQMRLGEDDVERLESATATFLEELGLSRRTWQKQRRVLQSDGSLAGHSSGSWMGDQPHHFLSHDLGI